LSSVRITAPDRPLGGLAGGGGQAVGLLHAGEVELAAADDQGPQFGLIGRALFGQPRGGELSEAEQHAGVDAVGLGEDAQALGEVTHASGVDQRDGQAGLEQRVHERAFEPARGLDDGGERSVGGGGGGGGGQ
jgi:hypothetical protein